MIRDLTLFMCFYCPQNPPQLDQVKSPSTWAGLVSFLGVMGVSLASAKFVTKTAAAINPAIISLKAVFLYFMFIIPVIGLLTFVRSYSPVAFDYDADSTLLILT